MSICAQRLFLEHIDAMVPKSSEWNRMMNVTVCGKEGLYLAAGIKLSRWIDPPGLFGSVCGDGVGGQQWDPKRSKRVGKKQEL